MLVALKTTRPNAITPKRATQGSAGFDLHAWLHHESVELKPGARVMIPTGIAFEIPDGYEGQIRPRSGLAFRSGVTVLNAPGTIDSDYRGEIGVLLINAGWQTHTLNRGDRIAQIVFAQALVPVFVHAGELKATDRDRGGFGSTGS